MWRVVTEVLAGLILVVGFAVAAMLVSGPGHAVARRLAVAALERAVDGRVRIGALKGALWRTVDLRDVRLETPDGRPVIQASRVTAHFDLADLVVGRYVLTGVEVDRPTVILEPAADGRLTLEHLFRLGGPPGAAGSARRLVDFRGVRLRDGTVVLRERTAGGERERDFLHVGFDLSRLRLSTPDSAGVVADVHHLSAIATDPAVRVVDAAGKIAIAGDSLRFDLSRLVLPASDGVARGTVRWGAATAAGRSSLRFAANMRRASFADFGWALAGLPRTGGGHVAVLAQLWPSGASTWSFRDADVATGSGRARGSFEMALGGPSGTEIHSLALDLDSLDLGVLVPFLGKMPVAGLVSGHLTAAGKPSDLTVGADLAFVDGRVTSRPVSTLSGTGVVALGGRSGFTFRHFSVNRADVALATIERLAPAVTLRGRLLLAGSLDGPWNDATFAGALRHEDGPGAASTLRGSLRLTLADTLRLAADVQADSLSFDDLAKSFPVIPLTGSAAGQVHLAGPLTALQLKARLTGPGGALDAEGEIAVQDSAVRIRVAGHLDSLDLEASLPDAPETRLTGTWRADLLLPGVAAAATGRLAVDLSAGEVAHVALRRAGAVVALTGAQVEVDTAYVEQPGLTLALAGTLGRPGRPAGQLRFLFRADTLANLAPLASWARRVTGDTAFAVLDLHGGGRFSGRVEGTTAAWTAALHLAADSATYGTFTVVGARGDGSVARAPRGYWFDLRAAADSFDVAGMRYREVALDLSGPTDSLDLHAAARFARGSSLAVDLRARVDTSGWSARVGNAEVVLLGRSWRVAARPRIVATAAAIAIDSLDLRGPDSALLVVAGRLPRDSAGDLRVAAQRVPLAAVYALLQRDTTGVRGTVGGSLHVTGTGAQPRFEGQVLVADAQFGDFGVPRLAIATEYADQRLRFHAELGEAGEPAVTSSGSLPLDLALESVAHRELAGPLDIRVRADSVDLAIVDALTTALRDVSGRLQVDAAVQGTWERPELQGEVRVREGAATVPALGARYSAIEARLSLAGDSLVIRSAQLKGGTGTLEIAGGVRLASLTRPVLDLALKAHSFAAFSQRDFAGLTGSGDLSLTGPVVGATLSGQWTVDAGFLAFADLVEKRIVNLDDPEFRAVVDSNLARAADLGPTAPNVFLDSLRIRELTVSMGPDVWLRSHEANIQLAGSFTVAKGVESGVSRYRLDGTLSAVRGTYRLVVGPTAKEFRVTRGTVRFFGTPDLNPVLDIAAEHTVRAVGGNDVVVRVVISGTLLQPKLSLESDERPPLSESEIVSYLLFGRPSFDLASGGSGGAGTTSEQAIFQGAMAGLAGAVSGELEQTLVTNLGIPVDYLAIRPGGGSVGDIFSSARVEAGTQIGERTFLTLNAGLCQVARGSQALGASVEHRLQSHLTVEASIEPTVQECRPGGFQIRPLVSYQVGFDLFWQWGTP